jgi:uncharacterized membrane protein (UPF0136 family)
LWDDGCAYQHGLEGQADRLAGLMVMAPLGMIMFAIFAIRHIMSIKSVPVWLMCWAVAQDYAKDLPP